MAKEDLKKVFCDTLIEMASADDRICLVNSDSRKYTATQDFDKAFPERSFDVGIAEANMVGVAAGLAVSGKKPFTQSFGPFMSRRVVDQVTISLAYSKLNAVLVGVSPGIQAEVNGGTHQGYEDIGVFRPRRQHDDRGAVRRRAASPDAARAHQAGGPRLPAL